MTWDYQKKQKYISPYWHLYLKDSSINDQTIFVIIFQLFALKNFYINIIYFCS